MQEVFYAKTSSIGSLMVACPNYMCVAKVQSMHVNPNFTPLFSNAAQASWSDHFLPNPSINPNMHFNPNFANAFQHSSNPNASAPQNFQQQRNNFPNFRKQLKPDKQLRSFSITETTETTVRLLFLLLKPSQLRSRYSIFRSINEY